MARRYRGPFSPEPESDTDTAAPRPAYDGARVHPVGARANLMFVPPLLLALLSLGAGPAGLLAGLVGAGFWTLGAWLLRDGLRAEAAYHARRVANRPALPRKTLAAGAAALGTATAVWPGDGGTAAALAYGLATGGLHVLAFGLDPLRAKGMSGVDGFQQDRVARVVDEAEAHLDALCAAARRSGDRAVESRVEAFRRTAEDLIRTVEEDPRDLAAARKYLGVYLMGARDAVERFAEIFARTRDAGAKRDVLALLDDLETGFGQRTRKLLLDSNSDLQVEIDVLRDRLRRDGLAVEPAGAKS
ncbi:5-bromo-4-chloroindolyl phosphate hydrolysis family protein [Roseivivax sp. CAU 1761]